MSPLDYALSYAERGWRVFPLVPGDKVPLIGKSEGGRGCLDGTDDTAQIRAWWSAQPKAGIGLHCGPGSGVWALDIDAGKPGYERFAALVERYGLPETLEAKTGGGGRHLLFLPPEDGRAIKNRVAAKIGGVRIEGIDVRSEGGYIVVAPSGHPSGGRYEWINEGAEIAPPPAWLVDLVAPPPEPPAPSRPYVAPEATEADRERRYCEIALLKTCERIAGLSINRRIEILKEAYTIGGYVGAGLLSRDRADAELLAAARACGADQKHRIGREIAYGLDTGAAKPRRPELRDEPVQPVARRRSGPDLDSQPAWLDDEIPDAEPEAASSEPDDTDTTTLNPEIPVLAVLRKTKDGTPKPTGGNAIDVLSRDSRWKGRIRLDAFAGIIQIRDGETWREIREADSIKISHWIERAYGLTCSSGQVYEAIQAIADDEQIHPVRSYLEGLRWDGQERIGTLLPAYIGATDTPLNQEISRCFLVSCVARIMSPGCKVDTVLILVGDQGRHKSSAFQALAADWFGDTKITPGDKDAYQTLPGHWIYELAEMETWGARAWGINKAFASSRADTYRPSYGRITRRFKRQVVFVGSTNHPEFLADPTGERRWWPVRVTEKIDLARLTQDRDQLWAEAVAQYRQGRQWWLPEELETDQALAAAEFKEHDAWEEVVGAWIGRWVGAFSIFQVAEGALSILPRDLDKKTQTRLGDVLRNLGCSKGGRGPRSTAAGIRPVLWSRGEA